MLRIGRAGLIGLGRVALAAVGVALWLPALATPVPFVPISGYTIFGQDGVFIGVGSTITGLVGARDGEWLNGVHNTTPPFTPAIGMNGSSKILGDARSGQDVTLANSAHITGTVTHPAGTVITLGSGSSVGVDNIANPNLPSLPAATSLTCPTGGADDSGANSQSRTLGPGSYGTYTFGGGFTLTLNGAGNYYFDAIHAGNGAQIIATVAGVHVFVCGQASFGGLVVTVPSSIPGPPNPSDISFEVQSTDKHDAFVAGGGSHVVGAIFAPNGGIHIGSGSGGSSFAGNLTGVSVDIEHGVLGSGGGCCQPPPGTITVNKDSTIIHGDQNTNNGASPQMWLRTQTADIVGFDLTDFVAAAGDPPNPPVSSARLVLTVCYTPGVPDFCPDVSSNWGPAGGKIGAYRVLALDDILGHVLPGYSDWAEGTGNTFPVFVTRGVGAGVTWNCKTDDKIQNNLRDCTGQAFWDSGGQNAQYPLTNAQTITNGMANGTKVIFDVTSDVNAGLLGDGVTSNFISWFIRWSQQNGGFVSFYSQEGAARALNSSLAPQLIITP